MDDESLLLLQRWESGDQQAAREIFDRYTNRLLALARSRLDKRLNRRMDVEDIAQSVYRCFFSRASEGAYTVNESGDLWRILATITVNKLRNRHRDNTAEKRSYQCELSFNESVSSLVFSPEAVAAEPTPDEAVALVEELDAVLLSHQPVHREIITLYLNGLTIAEIAEESARTERTVRRILERLYKVLSVRLIEAPH